MSTLITSAQNTAASIFGAFILFIVGLLPMNAADNTRHTLAVSYY